MSGPLSGALGAVLCSWTEANLQQETDFIEPWFQHFKLIKLMSPFPLNENNERVDVFLNKARELNVNRA